MIIKSAEFVKSAVKPEGYPQEDMPHIAFAGRSNVGKSSLINSLANRKHLARVSGTPGRTQTINFFIINESYFFVDLPGYGYAKTPLKVRASWGPMIERYLVGNPRLCLLVFILDARRIPSEEDKTLLNFLNQHGVPYILAVTKADKLSRNALNNQLRAIRQILNPPETIQLIPYSSKTGAGRKELLGIFDVFIRRASD
ncbi:MAG TPA: ribosome biogenesis GTP-binding protein YihA/YsxC [Candidatus Sumerlaeota bacterium]|nr:MAG: putative GTP-binding protein EngB [candidate division BRC1 bacterium ADurb.Bin183]HOE62958.1 ribosome biogenesis GTP-binding protein YihA/YsxC [Candidatus Sumerlaeota bacterium]HRR31761.1 ribosome biogenesis GTP-binding protein YihA/YsxC [Candidatus Sumerlaeia bacterium]HON49613.1 ribosome biogenesis GTP-binding protein YihA/YsxC [Candidatus Sumerlaeota bacterium]HOR64765.1 ribosome biogenesis GTP-binding protein YihA/YsxC [Candidatus Sumerlaeota bacterium]